jgi:hypothetical protein
MAQCVHVRANLREVQNGLKYTQKVPSKRFDICILRQLHLRRTLAQNTREGVVLVFRRGEAGRPAHRRELRQRVRRRLTRLPQCRVQLSVQRRASFSKHH